MGTLLVLFGFLALVMLVHGRTQLGFISIDCGLAPGSDYTDDETQISYTSDAGFIDTGKNYNASEETSYRFKNLKKQYMNVRSFPEGVRNCYTLRPEQGEDNKYLIRALFMYGNYDSKNQLPEFKLYLGTDEWGTVNFKNSFTDFSMEIIHAPKTNHIDVCLVNNGYGTPFISALELRPLTNSIYYKNEPGSLLLYSRLDFGAKEDELQIRDKDDVFDRIWNTYEGSFFVQAVSVSDVIYSLNDSEYKLPGTVMATAVTPAVIPAPPPHQAFPGTRDAGFPGTRGAGFPGPRGGTRDATYPVTPADESYPLEFSLDIDDDPSQKFYPYMHFAEVEEPKEGELREFTISVNGDESWGKALTPRYRNSTTLYSNYPVRGSSTNKLSFSIKKTGKSTLPPIINAMEVYTIKDFLQSSTLQDDVDAIKKIKSVYTMSGNWQGDPCLPELYRWTGLSCSNSGSRSIISLNLSSSNLSGKIDSSFSNLNSLQYLDLSYNDLTGEIPAFLAELPSLNALNLSGNNFTGSVPLALLRKSDNESLSLSLDGNPYLCKTNSCNEEDQNQQQQQKKNVTVPVVASIASVLLLLAALATLWRFKIRRHDGTDGEPKEEKKVLDSKNQCFSYSEVVSITDNFHKVIGKGGFGAVYSGHLKDDTQVAVKMLSQSSTQGSKQFRTEAQLLARIHHRNLASLIGYCDEGSNLGLLYEYMANGNLEEHLSGKNASVLSWEQRLRIAIDAAQALEYLHDGCKPPIIHRDVKTANILLNEKLQAKVGDFGLSRIIPLESGTHVSTAVVGTPGYLDPEYYITMRLTEKSDVYSFGIVLLELISGQPAIINSHGNKYHIVQWANSIISKGDIRGIVDPRLERDFNTNSVWKAVETAMACVPPSSIQRPTMNEVVGELKECLKNTTISHERAYSVKEESDIISSNLLEMVVLGIDEMGPQAR